MTDTKAIPLDSKLQSELADIHLASMVTWKEETRKFLADMWASRSWPCIESFEADWKSSAFCGSFFSAKFDLPTVSVTVQLANLPETGPKFAYESKVVARRPSAVLYSVECVFTATPSGKRVSTGQKYMELQQAVQTMGTASDKLVDAAYALALLGTHPNLLTYYKIGIRPHTVSSGPASLWMLFDGLEVDGKELWTVARGWGDEKKLISVASLFRGLAHIHSKGAVHLHVNQAHFLLTHHGRAVLGASHLAHMGKWCETLPTTGSRSYWAPEVLSNTKVYTKAADAWSAAVVALELLSGERLFPEEAVGKAAKEQKLETEEKGLLWMISQRRSINAQLEKIKTKFPYHALLLNEMLAESAQERLLVEDALSRDK